MALSAMLEARVSARRLWRFFQAAECRDMRLVRDSRAVPAGTAAWRDLTCGRLLAVGQGTRAELRLRGPRHRRGLYVGG